MIIVWDNAHITEIESQGKSIADWGNDLVRWIKDNAEPGNVIAGKVKVVDTIGKVIANFGHGSDDWGKGRKKEIKMKFSPINIFFHLSFVLFVPFVVKLEFLTPTPDDLQKQERMV